jgi:oligoribonuclease
MTKLSSKNLIWLDLEMTGLDPDHDRILEIAIVITDKHLQPLATSEVFAIHQKPQALKKMDAWNIKQHSSSGLIDRVKKSRTTEAAAEKKLLNFISAFVPPQKSPMCGNSICQDRRFLYRHMPKLEKYFHYRNLDVSTIKILARYWYPKIAKTWKKATKHEALSDIHDSIAELAFYRDNVFIQ